jgi:hypothetical protein
LSFKINYINGIQTNLLVLISLGLVLHPKIQVSKLYEKRYYNLIIYIPFTFVLFQSAMFGEMLGSGRATPKLLGLYVLFLVFAVASVARGLCSRSAQATPAAGPSPVLAAPKKRV